MIGVVTADYFDNWYADIARSPTRQQLFTDELRLPPEVGPSNMVPREGLEEIAALLRLQADAELVDFGSGRGRPGMWIARRLGTALIGIDFSAEAVRQASERRALFGLSERATFAVGGLDDTGLSAGGADGVICIDAFQFSPDQVATAREMRRVLRPGGAVVLSSWEQVDGAPPAVSERTRRLDVAASLTAAGFEAVSVVERPAWRNAERSLWDRVMSIDPGNDPAMQSARREAERVLMNFDSSKRVLATATAP